MPSTCSNPPCSNPGPLLCGRCKSARYCGPDCQRSQWHAHKAACSAACDAAAPKSNCYILHAAPRPPNSTSVLSSIAAQLEPLPLSSLGNEVLEKHQLSTHLGWTGAMEVGKFYDHAGADAWYYYVYGDARAFDPSSGLRANEAAGLVCYEKKVYGDVGIVRSGPVGGEFAEEFGRAELAAAVGFYGSGGRDPGAVFAEREGRRAMRKFGGGVGGGEEMAFMHVRM